MSDPEQATMEGTSMEDADEAELARMGYKQVSKVDSCHWLYAP